MGMIMPTRCCRKCLLPRSRNSCCFAVVFFLMLTFWILPLSQVNSNSQDHQGENILIDREHRRLSTLLNKRTKKFISKEAKPPSNRTLNEAVVQLLLSASANGKTNSKDLRNRLWLDEMSDYDLVHRLQSRLQTVKLHCSISKNDHNSFSLKNQPVGNESQCKLLSQKDVNQIFVNDDLGLLFCSVPKVACTQWKRILLALTGKMNVSRLDDVPNNQTVHTDLEWNFLRRLSTYNPAERCHRLKTYFKFMFVRDPMERLLSAFVDKFVAKKYRAEFHMLAQKIVAKYQPMIRSQKPRTRKEMNRRNITISFEMFVKYVINLGNALKKLKGRNILNVNNFNVHWRPMNQLCRPCDMEYDFVGKYETLEEDSNLLLRLIWSGSGSDYNMTFPKTLSSHGKTSKIIESSFANITPGEIEQLRLIYKEDYNLFGYHYSRSRLT